MTALLMPIRDDFLGGRGTRGALGGSGGTAPASVVVYTGIVPGMPGRSAARLHSTWPLLDESQCMLQQCADTVQDKPDDAG